MASCFFDSLQYDLHTSVHVSPVLCLFPSLMLFVWKLICPSTSPPDASLTLILLQMLCHATVACILMDYVAC